MALHDVPGQSASNGGGTMDEDAAALERARRYSRIRLWLSLVGMLWSGLTALLALTSGLSARLRDRATHLAPRKLGAVMPYTFAVTVLSALASLPLSYYRGYVLERRYGLTNQSRSAWAGEQLKGLAVGLALSLPLAQGAYAIIRRSPTRWWALLSALTVPFTVVLGYLAPVLILPIFNRFEPLKDRALAERVTALAEGRGVRVAAVLQMDMSKQTNKANAFFTGIGRTKRIVLADTLLDAFTPAEVEVVVAHELGHQVHRDLWKGIGVGALSNVATAYAVHRLAPPLIARVGRRLGLHAEQGVGDVAALPLLGLLLGAVSFGLAPLRNAWSRNMVERAADRYALDLTRNAEAFVGAMEKLGRMNLSDPNPPTLVKHLFYSHPPMRERIAFGRDYAGASRE